jgi:hypothetical protein
MKEKGIESMMHLEALHILLTWNVSGMLQKSNR